MARGNILYSADTLVGEYLRGSALRTNLNGARKI
jgi:hypothetical protein